MRYQIRKLGVGQILDQTISVVKDNFGLLFVLYAVTLMPFQIIQVWTQVNDPLGRNPNPLLNASVAILGGIAGLLFNAASIHGVASLYISRPTSLGDCLKTGARRFFPMLWTAILMGLALFGAILITLLPGGFVMGMLGFPPPLLIIGTFVLMIPAFILILWWLLAQEIAVLEHISGSDALGRSKKLMRNNTGKAFVLMLILGVINIGIYFAAAALFSQPVVAVALLVVAQAATSILSAAALVVLYFSARCEHENFDLQMLTSAVAEDFEASR